MPSGLPPQRAASAPRPILHPEPRQPEPQGSVRLGQNWWKGVYRFCSSLISADMEGTFLTTSLPWRGSTHLTMISRRHLFTSKMKGCLLEEAANVYPAPPGKGGVEKAPSPHLPGIFLPPGGHAQPPLGRPCCTSHASRERRGGKTASLHW